MIDDIKLAKIDLIFFASIFHSNFVIIILVILLIIIVFIYFVKNIMMKIKSDVIIAIENLINFRLTKFIIIISLKRLRLMNLVAEYCNLLY